MKGIECIELRKFITEYKQKNEKNEFKPVAVGKYGIRTRESIYSKELAKDYSKNKIIFKNTLTVGMGSRQIDIGILTDDVIYSVSPAYHTYKISGINADYLRYCLMCRNEDMFKRFVKRGSRQGKSIDLKRWLEYEIPVYDVCNQEKIVLKLNKVTNVISMRKQQLQKLDELIQARFVEMFGDPITNSKLLPIEKIEERYFLKAGITTKAEDIHDYLKDKYEIPCYGGNGIRGYVENLSYEGCYPIIGRQGALCGNVQYATGKFHATEHAVLVSTLKNDNTMWVYYMLKLMDLYRYHTGAAQPGLAVKKLNTIDVIVADINLQNQFAAFVHQINKSKFVIHKFLYCTTHNTKSIIKPRPNTKESGKIRGRETTCRRILTF